MAETLTLIPLQANAVSDKVLDLRKCSYKGANLNGKQLPGALMSDSDFSGAQLIEATLTKVWIHPATATRELMIKTLTTGVSRSGV